jgi:hypothetical protein
MWINTGERKKSLEMLVIGLRNEGKWGKKIWGSLAMKTESSGDALQPKK